VNDLLKILRSKWWKTTTVTTTITWPMNM
jgi:hypothetical protein